MKYKHLAELIDFADDKIRKMPKQRQEKYRNVYGIQRISGLGLAVYHNQPFTGEAWAVDCDGTAWHKTHIEWRQEDILPPEIECVFLLSLARLGLGDKRIF